MERNIIKIDEAGLKDDLKTLIRGTVEDMLNATASCRESPPLRSRERPYPFMASIKSKPSLTSGKAPYFLSK
jgi:hypothetical protein